MTFKTKNLLFALLLTIVISPLTYSQQALRHKINIPDIAGYKTLKCDFHMHTVFSDGLVWPTFRVEEAWRDGLDAIAITDHLEYRPYKKEIAEGTPERSYLTAKETADNLGITLIQGAEITRKMPPGHVNAIFLKHADSLFQEDWKDAVIQAKKQDAILFWNHPAWVAHQPDKIARWYDEHTYLLNSGILVGIEVVNGMQYSPEVHQWCLEKNLTMLANTDSHNPTAFDYEGEKVNRRTITLVFAKDNSPEAIKEALINRRTCGYFGNNLVGQEKFLREIFNSSVSFNTMNIQAVGRQTKNIQITNNSDVAYELKRVKDNERISFPEEIILLPGKTILFQVRSKKDDNEINGKVMVEYQVNNLIAGPNKGLIVPLEFEADIKPKSKAL